MALPLVAKPWRSVGGKHQIKVILLHVPIYSSIRHEPAQVRGQSLMQHLRRVNRIRVARITNYYQVAEQHGLSRNPGLWTAKLPVLFNSTAFLGLCIVNRNSQATAIYAYK